MAANKDMDMDLMRFYDGEAEPGERKAIEAHLSRSAEGREKINLWRNIKEQFFTLSVEPDPGVHERIFRGVMVGIEESSIQPRLFMTLSTLVNVLAITLLVAVPLLTFFDFELGNRITAMVVEYQLNESNLEWLAVKNQTGVNELLSLMLE